MPEHGHDNADKEHKPAAAHGGGGHGGGGGHQEEHEEHEGAPEWLISFADNTALMMGFFVILLALNMGPKGGGSSAHAAGGKPSPQELDWILGVRAAFHNPVRKDSTNPREQDMVKRLEELEEQSHGRGDRKDTGTLQTAEFQGISGAVNFDNQSSVIAGNDKAKLLDIAEKIRGLRLIVEVRGHVSAEEAFGLSDKGMHLSFERALSVKQELEAQGLDPKQFRIIAAGDSHRLRQQVYDPVQQRLNQRVEVIVTNQLLDDMPTESDAPASPPKH